MIPASSERSVHLVGRRAKTNGSLPPGAEERLPGGGLSAGVD
jgi:hypothetical protein